MKSQPTDLYVPHCVLCDESIIENYAGARFCDECRANLWEKAISYGGDAIELNARYARLLSEACVPHGSKAATVN
jgi:hypothetical protein